MARYRARHPARVKAQDSKYRNSNPQWTIYNRKKRRCLTDGVEFTIGFDDIWWPDVCPVLGVVIDYRQCVSSKSGPRPASPSFDRVDPTKGYVPGNVIVISVRANRIKNDATSAELRAVASWLEAVTNSSTSGTKEGV